MKSPRPLALIKLAALTTLSLFLLALTAFALNAARRIKFVPAEVKGGR